MFLINISRPLPLFLWRSSRTAAHPGILSGLVLLVSLVSWMAAMLTCCCCCCVVAVEEVQLFSSAFHCFSHRQLVGVGVNSGPGFILISLAH